MNLRPHHYLLISQIILTASVLLCTIIFPQYLLSTNQGGVSNFGTEDRTRVVFSIGFGAVAVGSWLAARRIRIVAKRLSRLRWGLYLLSCLYLLVLISTFSYKLVPAYRTLHIQAAILLFWGMLALAIWLRIILNNQSAIRVAFIVFVVGFVTALLTFIGIFHLLFVAQLICGFSFGYILVRGVASLENIATQKS